MPISQTDGNFENPYYRFFRRIYALSVGFKMKTLKKAFSNVKTKNQLRLCRKSYWRSNHSFLLSIWLITGNFRLFCFIIFNHYIDELHFSNICTIMELKKPNWLCKLMKNVRSSQPYIQWIFVLNSVNHKFFSVSIVNQFIHLIYLSY